MLVDPNTIGISGLLVVLILLVATGRLATWREVKEKNDRIALLEATLKTRDHQLTLVLSEAMTTISPVLRAMRDAVQSESEEDAPT